MGLIFPTTATIPKQPRISRIKDGITNIVNGNSLAGVLESDYRSATINSDYISSSAVDISLNAAAGENFKNEILKYITEQFSRKPIVKHECHSCGATLEINSKKHIFVCKYCGSTYAINTNMINDKGE